MKHDFVRTRTCTARDETSVSRILGSLIHIALLAIFAVGIWTDLGRAEDMHSESAAVFGSDLTMGWYDPPLHCHFSPRGTPMIHSFRTEPAFTRRDLLLDYSLRNETGLDEQEIAAELEWPVSRRLGFILEMPYVSVDTDDEGSAHGFGNLAISPRVLLADYERFLLAVSLEVETTTGDNDPLIAEDEVALAPSFSTWVDLGNWWAFNAQSGLEYPTESSDAEFFFRSSLIHTFGSGKTLNDHHTHEHHADEGSPGLVSVIMETDLALGLSGEEDDDWFAEGIVGLLVGLRHNADMRIGYQFPLSKSQDLKNGFAAGLIWHFK